MKESLLFVLALIFAQPSPARAASIGNTPWEKAHSGALSAFGKADVAQLLTDVTGFALPIKSTDIGEFTWADLQGDGRLELVATMDVNGRAFFNALFVLWREPSGKVTSQELDGWTIRDLQKVIRDLQKVIRDLNGGGQDELIIPTVLFQYNTAATFTWPVIYRLEKGKYAEASRDFPQFYEDQVLPKLEAQIRAYQSKRGQGNQDMAAVLIFEKNRILHMLGRNPAAGLQEAQQWINTDDPFLLLAATATFNDIPGHGEEAKAARAGYDRAYCERYPDIVTCKNRPAPTTVTP